MKTCKDCLVIKSLDNAWAALCRQYDNGPDEETRRAMNILGKMVTKIRADFENIKKDEEPHQISVEEWLNYIYAD